MAGDGSSNRSSWWTTLPGMITAVAALITALVGGVVALRQAGIVFTGGTPAGDTERGGTSAQTAETGRGSPSSVSPPAAPVPSVSPELDQVRVATGVFKILSVNTEPYDSERLTLALDVRLTDEAFGAVLSGDSFRLLVDSVPRAPETRDVKYVAPGAAEEIHVVFLVPRRAGSLVLRLINQDKDAFVPLAVQR